jgi:ABC-2 type transport system ATP-binding protein/lipopolysaccharide transport system ATP-binding protein
MSNGSSFRSSNSGGDVAIRAQELSKRFVLQRDRRTALKERFVRGRAPKGKEFWALRDATFDVAKGSMFGIIGHNGSGKSTALKVIAGIYRPTAGFVQVNGRMSALLELGAGFHPELTGRENIALNGSILGMNRRQIEQATEEIIDFSGLDQFIDTPIKNYSSGMYVRLGFAIAVKVDPEILVIDEVIAVGDEDFQRKCFDYIADLRARGSTIVIVTHAMGVVSDRCDQAIWLDHGRVQLLGPAREVVDAYLERVNEQEAARNAKAHNEQPVASFRRGSGEIRVEAIELLDEEGTPVPFLISNKPGTLRLHYKATKAIPSCVFGLGIFTETDISVSGPNTRRLGELSVPVGRGHIDFHMPAVLLAPDNYKVTTAIVRHGDFIDSVDRAFPLKVRGGSSGEPGLVTMPGHWTGVVTDSATLTASVPAGESVVFAPDVVEAGPPPGDHPGTTSPQILGPTEGEK